MLSHGCYYSHFVDDKTETSVTCPEPHSKLTAEVNFKAQDLIHYAVLSSLKGGNER